jgi:hypothetical protein
MVDWVRISTALPPPRRPAANPTDPLAVLAEFYRRHGLIWLLTALASVIVSAWCLYADPIINNDGIRYVRAADLFADGRWRDALAIYKWPFYPLLISTVAAVSGMSATWSAHLINAVLLVVLVSAFLLLVYQLGGEDSVTVAVAAVLIVSLPALNQYRSFVIRDFGYLAAYLGSLVLLIHYWRHRSTVVLGFWLLAACTATLFRIEGVAFLVLPPLLLGLRSLTTARARRVWLAVTAVVLASLTAVFALWLAVSESGVTLPDLVRDPVSAMTAGLQGMASGWRGKFEMLQPGSGGGGGKLAFASVAYLLTAAAILASVIGKQLGPMYGAASGWALWKGWAFPRREAGGLWWQFVVINLVILAGYVFAKLALPRRYALALVLTVLAAAPFAIARWYTGWRSAARGAAVRRWFPVLLFLMALITVRGLDVFTDQHHLRQAGLWLRGNTPSAVGLFSDNQVLIYFSGKHAYREGAAYAWPETRRLLRTGNWKRYDYLALVVAAGHPERETEIRQWLRMAPVHAVTSSKGEKVLIFAVRGRGHNSR